MGKPRTKRKNAQKRKARRVFATIAAELQATEAAQWTPEALERERKRNDDERRRVDDEWRRTVEASNAAFAKKTRVKEERQRLLRAIREVRSTDHSRMLSGGPI